MTIIQYMVPVIWSATEFFLSFWAIFLPFYPTNKPKIKMLKKWRKKHLEISSFYTNVTKILIILYCSWDMVHDGFNSYFSFWAIFWPLTPLTAQKLKISQKWKKKTPGGTIILQKCTKNHDHMLYCSWDMTCDGM